ncbi:unnamed protein product [Cylindrotheca closterium]|uniref:Uncharacterized protein n=1 Tax=Cylindrotheca closterium TaxID=2856 RepID=A0AAD2CQB2_9STRA|nr:unnamed protein product [Cylindrotheca closterium]
MAEDSEAAEAARAQAEARRKRILEKAQKRMGKVSGEVGQDDEDKKQSASNAARIRAARQRRYGRKPNPTEDEKSVPTENYESDEIKSAEAPGSNEESTDAVEEDNLEKPTTETTSPTLEATTSGAVAEASGYSEPKKKYLGVARMRRKMILKKKTENEEVKGKKEAPQESVGVDSQEKALPKTARNSIYMHIVTILLLFVAGFDVGLNQFHQDVRVHHQLVFKEVGIPLLHNSLSQQEENSLEMDVDIQSHGDLANEFDGSDEDESLNANIDPLFKVDLDELTKGPGFLNVLARAAVSTHRLLLRIFYFTPKNIILSLLSLPQALVKNPPTLCLLALILRQVVGKRILSAGIPGSDSEEKESGLDVVAMIKQGVAKWLSSAFPNALGIYDAFSHLRSDMYIIICGVFFGLAWSHTAIELQIPASDSATATDEL